MLDMSLNDIKCYIVREATIWWGPSLIITAASLQHSTGENWLGLEFIWLIMSFDVMCIIYPLESNISQIFSNPLWRLFSKLVKSLSSSTLNWFLLTISSLLSSARAAAEAVEPAMSCRRSMRSLGWCTACQDQAAQAEDPYTKTVTFCM